MKKLILILLTSGIIYSCSKTETTPTVTPPVVVKLSGCDSIKQGLLKTTTDTIRLVSCLSINGCDSIRLGILKPNKQDTLRLLSCIKISGCDSIRLDILKPNKQDTIRLLSCIKISGCDSLRLGLIKSANDLLRLNYCNSIITIGTQIWMKANLDVVTYRNGDTIPQVTDDTKWSNLTTGAWCYLNNDPANGAKYGKLYNWYAVMDSRGLAPQGWHIPTNAEWETLNNYLPIAFRVPGPAGALKEMGISNWKSPNNYATNATNFTARPGECRTEYGGFSNNIGIRGYWWTSTQTLITQAYYRNLYYLSGDLGEGYFKKTWGFSVRCLRD